MKKRSKGWIMNKCAGWLGVLFIAVSASAQVVPQTITLAKGWNAFYLRVDPGVTANDFFAAWPVDHASLYDSASFLRTAQFATDVATEPTPSATYLAWHRGLDDVSSLQHMAGDRFTSVLPATPGPRPSMARPACRAWPGIRPRWAPTRPG